VKRKTAEGYPQAADEIEFHAILHLVEPGLVMQSPQPPFHRSLSGSGWPNIVYKNSGLKETTIFPCLENEKSVPSSGRLFRPPA
jgi:hypothetical protein